MFCNDDQRQIVLGSLLGNGYICKTNGNPFFCMRHSLQHRMWLASKAEELKSIAAPKAFYTYKTTVSWRSRCHPDMASLMKLCYPQGKKQICMEWLDQLRDIAIAVWYGDSGCLVGRKNKNACLRTQYYGYEGNKIIERFFNEVNIPCNINKSRNSYVIVFTVEGTKILMSKIIIQWLPENRWFKVIAAA